MKTDSLLCRIFNGKSSAFTMAEILISLTVIGVVAALTLPALVGNINERTWTTRRKALYSRMSQAIAIMPSISGYGIDYDSDQNTIDHAAETFLVNGLGKVMELKNICSANELSKCGVPTKYIKRGNRTTRTDFPTDLNEMLPYFTNQLYNGSQSILNIRAAAFETKNGESVAVFYNPTCIPKDIIIKRTSDSPLPDWDEYRKNQYTQRYMCANFVYDLNGNKGPNRIGDDMGTITAMYSTEPEVVMPFFRKKAETGIYDNAVDACRKEGMRLPNIDELTSIWYNRVLWNLNAESDYISSTQEMPPDQTSGRYIWAQNFNHFGYRKISWGNNPSTSAQMKWVCVKR